MAITFDLPEAMEERLREQLGDLAPQAKEAFCVALYRQGKLSHVHLAQVLGLDRFETDAVLKRHGVFYEMTAEEVEREAEELRRMRGGDDRHR